MTMPPRRKYLLVFYSRRSQVGKPRERRAGRAHL
jgi:hypothetical protein